MFPHRVIVPRVPWEKELTTEPLLRIVTQGSWDLIRSLSELNKPQFEGFLGESMPVSSGLILLSVYSTDGPFVYMGMGITFPKQEEPNYLIFVPKCPVLSLVCLHEEQHGALL